MTKVAINGFGRIGRTFFKLALKEPELEIVALNDLGDEENLAYLLRYDTAYGRSGLKVEAKEGELVVDGKSVKFIQEKDPTKLPWKKLGVDVVVESTGAFRDKKEAGKHIKAGAKRVLITAPSKNPEITIVPGVNDNKLKNQKIISIASCTTNCLSPVAKILNSRPKSPRAKEGPKLLTHCIARSFWNV